MRITPIDAILLCGNQVVSSLEGVAALKEVEEGALLD